MTFTYEVDREADGRWIVDVADLPGCMAYGATREAALVAAQVLAFRVIADRIEHGEYRLAVPSVAFVEAA